MTRLIREQATDRRDLPHKFQGDQLPALCTLCQAGELDPRHLAWERANEQPPIDAALPRELGV